MSVLKEFGIPLTPFLFEVILRLLLFDGNPWWKYFDVGTLTLTFGFWSIFLIAKTPSNTIIPTDPEVSRALQSVKNVFTFFAVAGFIIFGASILTKTIQELLRLNGGELDSVWSSLGVLSITYATICSMMILLNKDPIKRMFV